MKKGSVIHMFAGCNTPGGFRSFSDIDLRDMERVFILLGGPGCGKSTLIGKVARNMQDRGYDVELWQSANEPESAEGLVIPELAVAVVDGSSPHAVQPENPGVVEEFYNLGEYWNQEQLRAHKDEICSLAAALKSNLRKAYAALSICGDIRNEICNADHGGLSESEMAEICDELAEEIFGEKNLRVRKFFAEALTVNGRQSYAQELSAVCRRRYIVYDGGSGKTADVLEYVCRQALAHGHNVDLYYRCLMPDRLEMVILPGLSVALVDSDCPDLEPCYKDKLLKLVPLADEIEHEMPDMPKNVDCDERQKELAGSFAESLNSAVGELRQVYRLHDELESYYTAAMDFDGVDALTAEIFGKIRLMASENARRER
jgi:hypothetical protein